MSKKGKVRSGNMDGKSFFRSRTLDELIAEQGVTPVSDAELAGDFPDECIDDFLAEIYADRVPVYERGE